jgi:carbon storage regulator CsrA
MLVLTRKLQEQIRIGNDIVITVLEFRGNSIKIGIDAPQSVRITRGELKPKAASNSEHAEHDLVQVIELQPEQLVQMTTETARASKMIVPGAGRRQPLAMKLANRREQPASSSTTDESSEEEGSARLRNVAPVTMSPVTMSPVTMSHLEMQLDSLPEFDLLGQEHLLAAQADQGTPLYNAV